MTIDEAIAHEKRISKDNKVHNFENIVNYHEQIAEWLEELKSYRNHVFSGEMTQSMLKGERNKAIDDFSEAVKELIVDLSVIRFKDIDEIAEQLKAGGENEI